mgnify:FL=1
MITARDGIDAVAQLNDHLPDFIPCMLIPLRDRYLLVPNATIAEVMPLPSLITDNNKPPYWLGTCSWHENRLPVIDVESLIDSQSLNISDANKLCVFHGLNVNTEFRAYSLPCCGVPQLIYINETALQYASNTDDSDYLHFKIEIGNKSAYMPNLNAIEATIHQQR